MRISGDERQEAILREVMARGQATVAELADQLHVTTETIRKDLVALQERNAIEKGHGIVTLPTSFGDVPFAEKETVHREEKAAIAQIALGLIPAGSSVVLEASTTNLQLAKLLVMRDDLIVFTNSLSICQTLAKSGNELFMVGGAFRARTNSCTGEWAQNAMAGINVDVAFLSCDGISENGPTATYQQLLGLDRMIIKHSRKTYMLMDTSKLAATGLYTVADFEDFDAFIFERPLSARERGLLPDSLRVLPEV